MGNISGKLESSHLKVLTAFLVLLCSLLPGTWRALLGFAMICDLALLRHGYLRAWLAMVCHRFHRFVMLCLDLLRYALLCDDMPRYATRCCALLVALLRVAMFRYALLCYAMLCFALL